MQDYERKSISEVVEGINRKYFLPDIQRDFVWKPEQVYALFDSIMRDYPISTFLFWKQNGNYLQLEGIKKLEFVKTSEDANQENVEIDSAREYFLVLDGQQRLTTFFLVLKGSYIVRTKPYDLYFNVLSGFEEKEDGVLFEFNFFNRNKGISFIGEDEDNDGNKIKKVWYRVKDIYDINIGDLFSVVSTISQEIKDNYSVEIADRQKNNIARLCQYLKAEKVIYYYPEIEKDYDKVLDIFVRTNSGGTKLSYSDLLFSTIKSKWSEARNKFNTLLTKINDNDRYGFSNDFVLKTALVIYAKNTDEVRYKTKNFKSGLISKIQSDWDIIERTISLCADLLKDRLFLTSDKAISSYNSLIPIIYWMFKKNIKGFGSEKNCLSDLEVDKIRTWLIKALFKGIFGGQSDAILYKCKEAIDASSEFFPAEAIENKISVETKRSMQLDSDSLDRVLYNSADSHLVLSVCYKGAINFQPRMKGNLPEQDHIFSQDELKNAGIDEKKINSVYNLRYIGSSENKIKSNTPFNDWMESIGKNEFELKKHLIPNGEWSIESFDNFLNERKKLLEANFKY
jgi:uncharacterized protein with ParB-like and HNH nuclease domain